jgi:hypothetical protein
MGEKRLKSEGKTCCETNVCLPKSASGSPVINLYGTPPHSGSNGHIQATPDVRSKRRKGETTTRIRKMPHAQQSLNENCFFWPVAFA